MKKILAALLAAAAVLTMSGCINKDAIVNFQTTEPDETTTAEIITTQPEPESIPEEILGQWYMDIDAMTDYAVEQGDIDSSQAAIYRAQLAKLQASVTFGEDGSYTSISADNDEGGLKVVMNNFTVDGNIMNITDADGTITVCEITLEGDRLILDQEGSDRIILTRTEPVYEAENPDELIGKWAVDPDATIEYWLDSGIMDEEEAEEAKAELEVERPTIAFSEDGTYQTTSYDYGSIDTDDGTYYVIGNQLVLDDSQTYTYRISDGNLIMEMGDAALILKKQSDEETGMTAEDIAGTWEIDRAISLSLSENCEDADTAASIVNLLADCNLTIIFTADGKVTQITVENETNFNVEGTFTIETYGDQSLLNVIDDTGNSSQHKIYFLDGQLIMENDSFIIALDKTSSAGTQPTGDDASELIGTWELDFEESMELSEEMNVENWGLEDLAADGFSYVFDRDGLVTEYFAGEEGNCYFYSVSDGVLRLWTFDVGEETFVNYSISGNRLTMYNSYCALIFYRS